ncbi:hypothetical protein [Desulfolucanica intricata]|uniref:hypothetical protein n=1 Tax=Desulfolucanica intricata TaxID=1285191 RepID=UPI00082A5CB9|nr:hypothetical protein [Desulfolucanica intricata]
MKRFSCFYVKRCLRRIKRIALYIAVPFSPLLVWFILTLNREIIEFIARSPWVAKYFPTLSGIIREDVFSDNFIRAFDGAALSGLLTLFGVIVTVWYYYSTRQQDLIERKFFVIDELITELKKNQREISRLNSNTNSITDHQQQLKMRTDTWHKLGADVALLPRRVHMRLSVLYGCLAECYTLQDYYDRKVTIDKISDLVTELHKYRSNLGKDDVI